MLRSRFYVALRVVCQRSPRRGGPSRQSVNIMLGVLKVGSEFAKASFVSAKVSRQQYDYYPYFKLDISLGLCRVLTTVCNITSTSCFVLIHERKTQNLSSNSFCAALSAKLTQ